MKILAVIALLSSLYTFVTATLAVTIDPDKGLKNGQWVELDAQGKKMRLIWFVFGALPPTVFAAFYLIN